MNILEIDDDQTESSRHPKESGVVETGLRRRINKLREKNVALQNQLDEAKAQRDEAISIKDEAIQARNEAQALIEEILERTRCPISMEPMTDAKVLCECGHTYSDQSLNSIPARYEASGQNNEKVRVDRCPECACVVGKPPIANYTVRAIADLVSHLD
ncbi:hypothetical protein SCHPADRAFT_1003386 [Schizopora paradoxa]|uniref:Zinc finger RING-type eukaryotic domain-containing protein n=1 Tax=Schizopora paradoxa TaxID=27342 RepID=A0A0H2QXN8_9AGAM|nr:hypothetical protein SCHPADRAFT_1003386 [Schizopora paradoxa]